MNYGPLLFLAAFFAMSGSWYAFVLKPNLQVGRLQQTNTLTATMTYPMARPGLAQQGLNVYRANGCAYCHTQQVRQEETLFQVMLTDPGTNRGATVSELLKLNQRLSQAQAEKLLSETPQAFLTERTRPEAEAAIKTLAATSAKAALWVVPAGPDIARGWGKRRNVAEDYLFDTPVLLGSQRIGPDLANVGVRRPDGFWHLRHLYAPASEVKGSIMPPYRFLFEMRKIGRTRSPNALEFSGDSAPPPGYEIVPGYEGLALAAYLVSLKSDAPLFTAPLSVAAPPPASAPNTNAAGGTVAAGTNTPAAVTNSATPNAPAK